MGYYLGIFLTKLTLPYRNFIDKQTVYIRFLIYCITAMVFGAGATVVQVTLHKKLDLHKLLGANTVQKMQTRGKSKAKMVNTAAVSSQFNCGCKFEGKCGIYHLCPLHFFALKLHQLSKFGVNQCFVHC